MVDVMFLLLVFYVLSSLAMTQSQGIRVALPDAKTAALEEQPQSLVVTINAQGETYLGTEKVEIEQLAARIDALCQTRPGGIEAVRQEGIVLNADQVAQMRQTVGVMDQLRSLGIESFSISTSAGAKP
jgi:biopolymer transport protein ExbD